jgi:pimeloyl-ACP methyl ester carboxylesterase
MNLDVIYDQVANVGEGLKSDDSFGHQTLFVRGSLSHYIQDEDLDGLKKHFPSSELVTVNDASHWLHVEKPDELSSIIKTFLTE